MAVKELRDIRKEMFAEMEQRLNVNRKPEDSFFYYHSSEDRIVLSHALFWVMTQNIRGHVAKEKYFLLLRQYQEEMLSAYLMESDEFPELLHYCNVMYETLPIILKGVYMTFVQTKMPVDWQQLQSQQEDMEEICQRNNATTFWMTWTSIIIR